MEWPAKSAAGKFHFVKGAELFMRPLRATQWDIMGNVCKDSSYSAIGCSFFWAKVGPERGHVHVNMYMLALLHCQPGIRPISKSKSRHFLRPRHIATLPGSAMKISRPCKKSRDDEQNHHDHHGHGRLLPY